MTFKKFFQQYLQRLRGTVRFPQRNPNKPKDVAPPILNQDLLPFASVKEAARSRCGRFSSHALLWGVAGAFLLLFIWASFAKIDESVTAVGQVIPLQGVQNIQNLEGGILEELVVREGQPVAEGDLLLRIFNEQASSVYRDALARQGELEVGAIRLQAELEGGEPNYPAELRRKAPQAILRHDSLLAARRQRNITELASLNAQLERSKLEMQELVSRQKSLSQSLDLAVRQRDLARKLFRSRSYSEMDLLNHEQQVQSIQSDLDGLKSSIPKASASVTVAEERLRLHTAETETRIREELNQASGELSSLREIVSAGEDRVIRTEVRSPVRGIVNSIKITTRGGVIMPGQTIMQVVPLEDSLIIEAKVRPQDIGFLYIGQQAKITLSAYDSSIYGGLVAELEHISADTIEGRMGEFYYLVRLRTSTQLMHEGKPLQIMPGMLATSDILTGRKTILSYIAKPLLKASQNAGQGY